MNSYLLRTRGGAPLLFPLYDFAPMFLDPEGIPRSSRWEAELEPVIGRPAWGRIAEFLAPLADTEAKELRALLARDGETVQRLPDLMRELGVEDRVIEGVARRCAEVAEELIDAGTKE